MWHKLHTSFRFILLRVPEGEGFLLSSLVEGGFCPLVEEVLKAPSGSRLTYIGPYLSKAKES